MRLADRLFIALEGWKNHPQRWNASYVLGTLYRRGQYRWRVSRGMRALPLPAIDAIQVEILRDPAFLSSLEEIRGHTMLDVARLANLWSLARLAGHGAFLEVGTFRGGAALHICNAIWDRRDPFYCFDPFEDGGFSTLAPDDKFEKDAFKGTSCAAVGRLLARHGNARVVKGFFPDIAETLDLHDIAFCHLDVDVHDATQASLAWLAPRLAPRSLIVLDDIRREVHGVDRAVAEFLANYPSFLFLPVFPSQGILLSKDLW